MSINISRRSHARRMSGLSLVELMIAMTLGLATIGAVGWVYLGATQTFRTQDAVARLQESARYAFETMSTDLRMAGATGCSYSKRVNVVNDYDTTWYANLFDAPVVGLDENGSSGSVTEFSDALRVLRADVSREHIVAAHDSGNARFTVGAFSDISTGDVLLVTDCNNAAVFAASNAASPSIFHATSGGNATTDLGDGGPIAFTANFTRIYPVSASTYYVDQNPAGVPSLYRERRTGAEELVEGVEDLQVTFGVDTTGDDQVDMVGADAYLTSAEVSAAASLGATPEERWSNVISIRLSLLMRTVEDNVLPTRQGYSYEGVAVAAADTPDRRLRKVFTHVIKLRNR